MARNHLVTGNVTYTTAGEPTIVDGVASGFSENDYLNLPNISNFQSFEQHVKFTTASLPPLNSMPIIGTQFLYSRWGLKIDSNNKMLADVRYQLDGSWSGMDTGSLNFTLEENTTYYGKLVFENNRLYCGISTDDANWTYSTGNTLPNGAVLAWPSTGTNNAGPLSIGGGTQYTAFNGSIDLNETYIKVNGQAWFGPCPVEAKHLNHGTTVGYTKEGSPTITDGVVSGFSSSNYIKTSQNYTQTNNELKLHCTFVSSSQQNNAYTIIGNASSGSNRGFAVSCEGNNKMGFGFSENGSSWQGGFHQVNYTIEPSTKYDVEYDYYPNKKIVLRIKKHIETIWNTFEETITGFMHQQSSPIVLGNEGLSSRTNFPQSIDLNETYIKINGELWFFRPCVNYQVHNDKLVFADSELYLSGPVNYTTVGNPVVIDGVASTSSDFDYFESSEKVTLNSSADVEVYARFKTPSEFPSENCTILGVSKNDTPVMWIYAKYVFFTIRGSASTLSVGSVSENTWYRVKAVCKNNNWSLSLYNDNGSLITINTKTAANSSDYTYYIRPLCYYGVHPPVQFLDLKETYVKVNGDLWLYGKNYASQNIAPVRDGYKFGEGKVSANVIGSLTISNGVVSGFSADNGLKLTNFPMSSSNTFEIVVKSTTTYNGQQQRLLILPSGYLRVIGQNANWNLYIGGEEKAIGYIATYPYVKLVKQNGNISIYRSTDGSSYEFVDSIDNPTITDGALYVGKDSLYWGGSLDLKETYIKVNNEMWFNGGKSAPGVGYFDMETQQFTAAPAGATIGKDE